MAIRAAIILGLMAVASYHICQYSCGPEKLLEIKQKEACENYVRKALPIIILDWKYEEWLKRITAETNLAADHKKVQEQFRLYKKYLGRFHSMGEPVGYVGIEKIRGLHLPVGNYIVRVRFRNMSANIHMKLVNREGGWKIQAWSVRPEVYLPIPEDD